MDEVSPRAAFQWPKKDLLKREIYDKKETITKPFLRTFKI